MLKYKNWPYVYTMGIMGVFNDTGTELFVQIYDKVYDKSILTAASEKQLSNRFQTYCYDNITGVVNIYSEFKLGVFVGAKLFFKDEASLVWFKLRYE